MTTERNLGDVLDQILAVIPQGEEGEGLRHDLKKIGYSLGYSPPEALQRDWGRVFGAIAAHLPIDTTPTKNLVPWQRQVMLIWMDLAPGFDTGIGMVILKLNEDQLECPQDASVIEQATYSAAVLIREIDRRLKLGEKP